MKTSNKKFKKSIKKCLMNVDLNSMTFRKFSTIIEKDLSLDINIFEHNKLKRKFKDITMGYLMDDYYNDESDELAGSFDELNIK
jgi:hypothetical protein